MGEGVLERVYGGGCVEEGVKGGCMVEDTWERV